jgi:hypothetical protein
MASVGPLISSGNELLFCGLFRNEHGKAEFAKQVVKDAKGMTFTPDKRYDLITQMTPAGPHRLILS